MDFELEICRKAFRRGMSLKVCSSGLVQVAVAKLTSEKAIQQFVSQHEKWIKAKILKYKSLQEEYPQKGFVEGEHFLFLGKWYVLELKVHAKKRPFIRLEKSSIVIYVPQSKEQFFSSTQVQKELLKFYKSVAKNILLERINIFSKRMNLYPKKISFRRQKTLWGSCSSEGHLSLNWKLVAAPIDVLDYVVIHELAHLKYQDHSVKFWELVEDYCSNYFALKNWLSHNCYEFDFLSKQSELHNR